jgi:hypothetical protein
MQKVAAYAYLKDVPLLVSQFQIFHKYLWSILSRPLCSVIGRDLVSVFYMWISSFPNPICWRGCLFSNVCLWHLCQEPDGYMGLFWGALLQSIDLHVCFFQYHAVLVTTTPQYNLKSSTVIPPKLFFFLRMLWLAGIFCARMWILGFFFVFYFCEERHSNFYGDCIESGDLQWYCYFHNVNSEDPHTWEVLPSSNICFTLFLQCFILFVEAFYLLG